MSHPTCAGCDRACTDRIEVQGVLWVPDLKEVRPNVWRCWECRGEGHPDMPDGYLKDAGGYEHAHR